MLKHVFIASRLYYYGSVKGKFMKNATNWKRFTWLLTRLLSCSDMFVMFVNWKWRHIGVSKYGNKFWAG